MVACPEPLAAKVGIDILKEGGNAVDAAVAAAFVQGVANPQLCGIGGSAQLLVYIANSEKPKLVACGLITGSKTSTDTFEYIPGTSPKKFKDNANIVGYKSATVPTFVRDVTTAYELWGTMKLDELLAPAVKLCEKGFVVYPYIDRYFNGQGDEEGIEHLSTNAECARIYLKQGRPYRVGDVLVQKEYGNTLSQIAKYGPDVMYKGQIGDIISEDFEKNDGLLTKDDLRECKAEVYEPLETTFRDCVVFENRPPTSGPLKLMILNILENFDLMSFGWNTPDYIRVVSRAIQFASKERRDYLDADPNYYPQVYRDLDLLLSKEHAKELARRIVSDPAPIHHSYVCREISHAFKPYGTTYLGVVDSKGNAVSMKHSIGSSAGIVTPGLGFMYNNHMAAISIFDLLPSMREWIRPRCALGGIGEDPSMVFMNSRPYLLGGSPGGPWGAVAWIQALLNITQFSMTPQQAVSVPRFHADGRDRVITVESSFPSPYPIEELKSMGNLIEVSDYSGRLSMIKIDPSTGEISGGADPRGGGGLAYFPT